MAYIKEGIRYAINHIKIEGNHLIEARLSNNVGFNQTYSIQCTGSDNYLADAYSVISLLPEWVNVEIDLSDIAVEFPGSGNASLFINPVNLANEKVKAKNQITLARNLEEFAGFTAYGKVFDSDAQAVQRISVGVQAANAIGESFSIEWTCADNSTIILDYAQMIALPAFMAQAANILHIKARGLKDLIDSATSIEEINAVVW